MSTHARKHPKNGWEATTDCPVKDDLFLRISTYKHGRGGLITTATCHTVKDGCLRHRLYSDFHKTRVYNPDLRCTEANVETQHKSAMGLLDAVMTEVWAHYKLEEVAA
jgi:hypothetical protein